jgi:ATP-dependent helicase/nuclease subunit B
MSVFTIPPHRPFADTLAARLLAEAADDPLALAGMTVLLPTRRAGRTLREAFLRRSGGRPLLLPRMTAIGDLDEDEALFSRALGGAVAAADGVPPVLPPLRRRLLLARLVQAKGDETGRLYTADQAVRLADELARLLDQVQTEGLSLDRLAALAPERYARHWQIILDFLGILTDAWPAILAEAGCLDPAERRNRLLAAQAAAWAEAPPPDRIIAAGITGSVPAAADLLAVVAGLPAGAVVLPGLDRLLDEESWRHLDESHPQHALKRLLDRLGLAREAVADWPLPPPAGPPDALAHDERVRLISEALRPAPTTHLWRHLAPFDGRALRGVDRIDCPAPREEALVIALMMREVLEHPERTAALVTPDRDLARRVTAELRRWGITVDDSAGRPLAVTPPGAFLRLTARMVGEAFAPVPLLAALKHPLCAAGGDTARFRDTLRGLERQVLRGVRPGPGLAGLRHAIGTVPEPERSRFLALVDALEACCGPFVAAMAEGAPLAVLLEAHMRAAEALAATDREPGPLRLWAEEAGEGAAAFARDLAEAATLMPAVPAAAYPALFDALMSGQSVRAEVGSHPRLAILGPLEARLHHADLVILGGMNEDVWPPRATADPWMSRPMRGDFGLPLPEQRVGHAAHDFASAFCAPRVVLTRSEKVEGTPTVPSRWLLRLDTVMVAGGLPPFVPDDSRYLDWAAALDRPARVVTPDRPAPRPPVAQRPAGLSATRVETWMRDPYAIYAQYVLGLRALDPLDAEPGPADYGTLVHGALEAFQNRYPTDLPADVLAALLDCGRVAFETEIARPAVWAFWWPRFERLAAWVAAQEAARRPRLRETHVEVKGSLDLGGFLLTATADRIDLMQDGSLAIVDYKTGAPPSEKEVKAGFAPQLPLEALIARAGGFPGVPARAVSELAYWHLKGGAEGGAERRLKDDPEVLAEEALTGLRGLIDAFSRPETPYVARPHPERAPGWSDYLHLARVKEWAAAEGDGG